MFHAMHEEINSDLEPRLCVGELRLDMLKCALHD